MAHQDVFVTITDINGTRQSYSCRRKVNWVTTNIYYSNNAHLRAHACYDPSSHNMPTVHMSRDSITKPLAIDITALLGTNTKLIIDNCPLDLTNLDADKFLSLIAACKLSGYSLVST